MTTKEDAIKTMEYMDHVFGDYLPNHEAFLMAIEALKQSEQKKWIPFNKKSPETPIGEKEYEWDGVYFAADEYLVMIEGMESPAILLWTGDDWIEKYSYCSYRVVAWMPLPESYQEENRCQI